jgi:hypothetical protein
LSSRPSVPYVDAAVNPIRTTPVDPEDTRRATSGAESASDSSRRASTRNTSPAAVSVTLRLSRSSSWAPTTRSSFWICRLSGGWVIFSRAAARPKCSSSATATNPRNCSNVKAMLTRYQSMLRWFWTGIVCRTYAPLRQVP